MDDEQPWIGRPQSYVLPLPHSDGTSKHSRATSTVAQSFATDLDSIFGLSNSGGLATLSQTVEEK